MWLLCWICYRMYEAHWCRKIHPSSSAIKRLIGPQGCWSLCRPLLCKGGYSLPLHCRATQKHTVQPHTFTPKEQREEKNTHMQKENMQTAHWKVPAGIRTFRLLTHTPLCSPWEKLLEKNLRYLNISGKESGDCHQFLVKTIDCTWELKWVSVTSSIGNS